jgi:CDP-diacylglycerol--glycerol-3-phosphate 3-phosphatidyltransferase
MTRWFFALLTRLGATPNRLTLLGLLLVLVSCAAYLLHRDSFWLGVSLAISFSFDALDGALARAQGTVTKFGGYLDAVVDRYQEIAAFLAIAWVTGWWLVCFLAVTGATLTSYNKARLAIEMPIQNKGWPDLMERPQRLAVLLAGLLLDNFIALPAWAGARFLFLILAALALLTHVTAVQRFFRARRMLERSS